MVRQLLSLYISSVIIKGFVANSSSSSAEVWTPVLGTNLIVGETSRVRTTPFFLRSAVQRGEVCVKLQGLRQKGP